jgi:hypothetical protein
MGRRLVRAARIRAWESLAIRKLGELESAGSNPAALTGTGCGKAWPIRLAWDQEIAGSNPAIPNGRCDVTWIKREPRTLETPGSWCNGSTSAF